MRTTSVLAAIALFACAGCGDTDVRGFVISESFSGVNSDSSQARIAADSIRTSLDRDLAPRWRCEVVIEGKPVYEEQAREFDGRWVWPQAVVRVTLVGEDPAVPCPVPAAEVERAIQEFFKPKLKQKPPGICTVAVESRIQPRYAVPVGMALVPAAAGGSTAALPPSLPTASGAAAAPAQRSYVVQEGDTLADISALYFGSPQQWRRIVAANPGLDPAALKPGTVLVIPPRE